MFSVIVGCVKEGFILVVLFHCMLLCCCILYHDIFAYGTFQFQYSLKEHSLYLYHGNILKDLILILSLFGLRIKYFKHFKLFKVMIFGKDCEKHT